MYVKQYPVNLNSVSTGTALVAHDKELTAVYAEHQSIATDFAGTTAPQLPVTNAKWLDTSASPPILKRWNGSSWVTEYIDHAVAATATEQAGIATAKALEASTSATNAGNSEANALSSQESAATSETNAASSANAANLAAQNIGTLAFTTVALMNADLAHDVNTICLVTNDTTASNNGQYIKLGASGTGSWQKSAYIPPVANNSIIETKMGFRVDPQITVSTGGYPTINKSGTNLIVTFPKLSKLYALRRTGGADYKSYTFSQATTFTMASNTVLVWDLVANTVTNVSNGAARVDDNVLLLSNHYGYAFNGKLMPYVNFKKALGQMGFVAGDAINIDTVNHTMSISANTSIYCGDTRYYPAVARTINYTLSNPGTFAFGLFFDTNSNNFIGLHHSLIPTQTLNSYVQIGWVDEVAPVKAYINGRYTINGQNPCQPLVQTAESRARIIDNFTADQGMTVVGEQIWVFRASADDHSTNASVAVHDKNTFELLGVMTHNLGHAANVNYCQDTDTVVSCASNLTYGGVIVYPEIQLLTGASTKVLGGQIDYTADTIKIPLHTGTKNLGRTGFVVAFGEAPHIIYAHSILDSAGAIDTTKTVMYKIILGMGANDFSDSVGTDLTKWGTFIGGKGDNEYNGTAKILATYTGNYLGTNQGLCYHEGYCYLAVTSAYNAAEVIKIQLNEDNTLQDARRFRAPTITTAGNSPGQEAEGCDVLDGRYLIAGYRGTTGEKLALFPLYNEQGGKGTTGNSIVLPFKCKSVPQLQITPTSNVTDLYVSAVNATEFTVSSASGQTGTFNWSCRIS